jgi:hypothetical protein
MTERTKHRGSIVILFFLAISLTMTGWGQAFEALQSEPLPVQVSDWEQRLRPVVGLCLQMAAFIGCLLITAAGVKESEDHKKYIDKLQRCMVQNNVPVPYKD